MRTVRGSFTRAHMLASIAAVAIVSPANAAERIRQFDLPAQSAEIGIPAFARQAGVQIVANGVVIRGKRTNAVRGQQSVSAALQALLAGTGLVARGDPDGAGIVTIVAATTAARSAPSLAQDQASANDQDSFSPGDEEIIVTAQKREEKMIDVPIAITAMSAKALDDRKIEGGSELLRAVPNVNFSKGNFSMYNFSIRGIGTKAVSASSDPAVAVSFNNTPLVRNRLFEAEFFDVERVEILRGPQGTLYGRNATAGVVNMLPAMPKPDLAADLRLEGGNYGSMRANGMVNVPLGDTLGVRVAGAWTSREGFDYNSFSGKRVNGRNLWSTRGIVAWEPSDTFRANAIWQHFDEDDNRSRTGKQLCTRDPGPQKVGNTVVTNEGMRAKLSQGCLPGSLYDDAAFGTPNSRSLVYVSVASGMSLGYLPSPTFPRPRVGAMVRFLNSDDPYEGVTQSRNMREIATTYDPVFRATNDLFQFNWEFEPADGLKFISQTGYAKDNYYSSQDYNRYVSNRVVNNSSQPLVTILGVPYDVNGTDPGPTPGGMFCDPQLGCSDRMISADISKSVNRQWSQEFRLQSDFAGPLNFNIGVNYLDFKSKDDYYVFNNMFTAIANYYYSREGISNRRTLPCELGVEKRECPYIDPNPLSSLNNQGHNYFLSQNGVRIKSFGLFGELYWNATDNLKLTLGGRYTRDRKTSTQVPSQLLLGGGNDNPWGPEYTGDITGGRVNSGYPALPDIHQSWGAFTGRAVIDWKPDLDFTDETLIYASASRGYKGGGTNPPRVDFNPRIVQYQYLPDTFLPEYVNALEIGTKNSLAGGRVLLNATGFFYDYKNYQVSQIVDRIAYNENFGATSMGLEFEAAWRPSRAFRMDGNIGLLRTRMKNGSESIDVMNRTQGDPDWVTLRPWLQVPSNCIAPRVLVERLLSTNEIHLSALCPGATRVGTYDPSVASKFQLHRIYGITYNPLAPYNPATVGLPIAQGGSGAPNGGRGFAADLSGNELPNSPRWTANIGAQYTFFLNDGGWELTFRGDYYRQAASFARVYNTEFDRLKSWGNVNAAVTLERPASGLTFQLYVKNVTNDAPITDFFVNSDDTGLTTNVFTLDPRIIAFSMRKRF